MLKFSLIVGFCIVSTISFSQEESTPQTITEPVQAKKIVKVERLERASKLKAAPVRGKKVVANPNIEGVQSEKKSTVIKD